MPLSQPANHNSRTTADYRPPPNNQRRSCGENSYRESNLGRTLSLVRGTGLIQLKPLPRNVTFVHPPTPTMVSGRTRQLLCTRRCKVHTKTLLGLWFRDISVPLRHSVPCLLSSTGSHHLSVLNTSQKSLMPRTLLHWISAR